MIKKWMDSMFGEKSTLREKVFFIILAIGLLLSGLSLLAEFALGANWRVTFVLVAVFLILLASLWMVKRTRKIDIPAVMTAAAMNFILFPISFFFRGGIDGGAVIWYVFGILTIFLLFRGKLFGILLTLTIADFVTVYYVSYRNPEYMISMAGRNAVYQDSLLSVAAVGIICGCLVKFQSDIYEKERENAREQQKELETMSQSKSIFFANMSHEIRTPINTIIGLNEMTLREDISDEIAENSINIQNASKMLLALINDILDLSKIESGRMEIVPVQYETGAMFSDLVNIIWIRAHEKKLEFKIDISEEIPSMLYGDEVRIKQVLTNILTNAVKYTKEGSVTLSAKSEWLDNNTVRLRVSVADTGMGIRKEDVEDLFTSYKRVDEAKNRKIEGTGLGMSISKQLIEMMGGKITVDSIYTKGSVFTVTLDQKIVDETPVGSLDFMIKKKIFARDKYRQSFEAPEAKVLIVDDNEMNLMVACKLLRSTRVQVDTASSGKECLEKTRHKFYHVIFMDHMMPEMDGVETLKQIRLQENGLCRNAPVIALTANAMSGADKIYQENGFQGYLAKPINGALLEAMLAKYLPDELVEYSMDAEELAEERKTIRLFSGEKKHPVMITTDCVCDLPEEWLKEFEVRLMYYYVQTNQGRFCDLLELTTDNLLKYLETEGNEAYSSAASVEEYETFFADGLEEAERIIHISMAAEVSKGYDAALQAARGFDNVTVLDSKHLSSGMGLIVMCAAQMAKDGYNIREICAKADELRERISTSFIVSTPENLYKNGKISKRIRNLCEILELHPVLRLKQGKMLCTGIKMGRMGSARRKYIRQEMRHRKQIDTRILFITHAGCSVKQQQEIAQEVEKYVKFDRVVFQKSSATISSNCGLGAFGLLFIKKK